MCWYRSVKIADGVWTFRERTTVLRYTFIAYLITSTLPDQGDDTVGELLRTTLDYIFIFQVTSWSTCSVFKKELNNIFVFTAELFTCSCQPISNIPPGIFPEMLYTNRHACRKDSKLRYGSRYGNEEEDKEQQRCGESVCSMEKAGGE